jgi:hypothetical protein
MPTASPRLFAAEGFRPSSKQDVYFSGASRSSVRSSARRNGTPLEHKIMQVPHQEKGREEKLIGNQHGMEY